MATAVLVSDTAVPAWHEARRELPFLFAGGALSEATPLGAESLSAEQQADRLAFVEVFRSQGTTQPDHAKVLGEPNARPD